MPHVAEELRFAHGAMPTLHSLMEHVPEGVVMADASTLTISHVSRRGCEMFQVTPEQMRGVSIYDQPWPFQLHPAKAAGSPPAEIPLVRATVNGEQITDEEWFVDLPDGQVLAILCSAGPIRNEVGEITGGIVVWRDISRRYGAEQANLRRVHDMEQQAAKRLAELQFLARELTHAEQGERDRIARLLHDHLQQLLVAGRIQASLIDRTPSGELSEAASRLSNIFDEALKASRSLTAELSPPILRQQGLGPALRWLAGEMKRFHGLHTEVAIDIHDHAADLETKTFLFHTIRELLLNIVKHSGTNHAKITAWQLDDQVHIVVKDPGRGFDPALLDQQSVSGFGLVSMQKRLEALGGYFEVKAASGHGVEVRLAAPWTSTQPNDQLT